MNEGLNFRGLVFSRYKSVTDFAKAVGWSRNKASRILNGVQEPDSHDIVVMTKALNITSQKAFINIFFTELSTLVTENQ